MAKDLNTDVDGELKGKIEKFTKNINSGMHYKAELTSDSMSFDWLNEIEFACPYIDNLIRNPKVYLINEEDVVKIEKAKKTTVASIKDLSRHTNYIEKINLETNEIRPSKILIQHPEETFNTYENRFIYTLVVNLFRFIIKKESLLEDFETKNDKVLEYAASTINDSEKVNIELKISSKELPKGQDVNDFEKEIASIRARVKKIRDYSTSWQRSEFIKSLEKIHVSFVTPPIRKTNLILKNPNFQVAMRLWGFLQNYDNNENESSKDSLDTIGNDILKGILDDSFLMDYYVLDSVRSTKKEQKQKLVKYAVLMITQQVQRAVSLLLNSGIEISEEEILSMLSAEIKSGKSKVLIGSADVKKKFKNVMDEYMERTQDYL